MSYAEDKWDATRQSEEERDCPACDAERRNPGFKAMRREHLCFSRMDDYGDEWHCHSCGDGGKTPWDPTEGCPRYPCHAYKPAACRACPQCGWVV